MIKSMTGFGKGESSGKSGRFVVEIRTVNHRYFDMSSRTPNSLAMLEDRIKNYIHKYIKRGKVSCSVSHRKTAKGPDSIKLDQIAIARYYKMLSKIKTGFKLKDEVRLSHILSFPDVIIQEEPRYDFGSMWSALESAIKKALVHCNRMREKEGRNLYRDFTKRITKISGVISDISKLSPKLVSEYKNTLDSKINDILRSRDYEIDRARLETELAIFARQCDISEELTRARSHLKALKEALLSNREVGRRLDFILQELQREINTLGSKAGSYKISALVIEIKSEIDKMREQAQNVE